MNTKLLLAAAAVLFIAVVGYNFVNSPPVGFVNVTGDWQAGEGGPLEGCVRLSQPGAGVEVFGFASAEAASGNRVDMTGGVTGNRLDLTIGPHGMGGTASLTLGEDGMLAGTWTEAAGEGGGTWRLARAEGGCF